MSKTKSSTVQIRRIAVTAVFISLSLVLKVGFSFYIPLFGQNGISIGISGVFTALPALLFGPVYGGAASGIVDVLGHIIRPAGAYMPLITLANILGGILRGFLWQKLRSKETFTKKSVTTFSSFLLIISLWSTVSLAIDGLLKNGFDFVNGDITSLNLISRFAVTRASISSTPAQALSSYTIMITLIPFISAVLGFLLLFIAWLSKRHQFKKNNNTSAVGITQVFITMLFAGIVVSTLNTLVLRQILFPSWQNLPFIVVWLPRTIESVLSIVVESYIITLLYDILLRQKDLRTLENLSI